MTGWSVDWTGTGWIGVLFSEHSIATGVFAGRDWKPHCKYHGIERLSQILLSSMENPLSEWKKKKKTRVSL